MWALICKLQFLKAETKKKSDFLKCADTRVNLFQDLISNYFLFHYT